MIQISYTSMMIVITVIWILVRLYICKNNNQINWKRELQLILVYICIIVVARFVFFPFAKVDGKVQPLIFDIARVFPVRMNLIPFVNLLDYEILREAKINVIGNTAMFIPMGVIWPIVFKELNTHKKVIAAGAGFSLCIEILQLPFYDRVSDVDDLILNTLGFVIGYIIYVVVKKIIKKKER